MTDIFRDKMFFAEQKLGRLAMKFRRCRDTEEQKEVVDQYAEAVEELIDTGTWNRVPPPEDQLPDEWMPQNFFDYWDQRASDSSV